MLAIAVAIGSVLLSAAAGGQTRRDDPRVLWVEEALKRMQTIKPGMTRKELLNVMVEGQQDRIAKISGPFLAFSIAD